MPSEAITVTLRVIDSLESLGVPYFVGGSLAGAVHGVARATLDCDIVADLHAEHVDEFIRSLGDDFYADAEAIRDAIGHRTSFNIVHLQTMFKVDVFVTKWRPFDREQFERRTLRTFTEEPTRKVYLASAEDTVLAKLEWFRLSGDRSERQWLDVMGIIKAQREMLDLIYLQRWARELGMGDLLQRAFDEAQ